MKTNEFMVLLKPVTDLVSGMAMPITPEAQFDGISRGWCVFEPGTGHYPTVSNVEALPLPCV